MTNKPNIEKLNVLLEEAANNHQFMDGKIYYLKTRDLEKELTNLDTIITTLEQEIENDLDQLLMNATRDLRKKFKSLISEAESIDDEKKAAVKSGDYEKAARLRDTQKNAEREILNEIALLHGFKQGFNWYNGKLLVITEGEMHKSQVLTRIESRSIKVK